MEDVEYFEEQYSSDSFRAAIARWHLQGYANEENGSSLELAIDVDKYVFKPRNIHWTDYWWKESNDINGSSF
jgi:hypothetical protein